ncbi:MAG: TrkA family potassium uptake protein [Planctomycetaceae bacterium]|nr:TrkA family potassium uptake protein [Planctomycetaceae bacterium]
MKVLIAGGGKAVYFLCRTFMAKGHHVTLVNADSDECTQMARRLKLTVVCGDASAPAILEEAGAYGADAVLAITPRDQDNLAICQLAAMQHHVPQTVALVNDPDNEAVFEQLGVKAFSTARTIASIIEQHTTLDEITNLIPAGEGRVNITEVRLKTDAPVVGKTLRELSLPGDALIAVVLRNAEAIVPRGETQLHAGDRIVLITLPSNHGPVLKAVTGESD